MYEYEHEDPEPGGGEEAEPCGDDLTAEEWNKMLAAGISYDAAEFDDAIELPDDRSGLAPDEDLPEMEEIIHNIWEC